MRLKYDILQISLSNQTRCDRTPRAHQHGTVLATQIHPEFDYVNEEGTLAYDLLSRFNLPKISDDEEHFE